jgi:hypothetical protein
MITKPAYQKILKGIPHTEEEERQSKNNRSRKNKFHEINR